MDDEEHQRLIDASVITHIEQMPPESHVIIISLNTECGTCSVVSTLDVTRSIQILRAAIKAQESRN